MHRQHLGDKPIRELEALARETPSGDDDALVRRLDEVRTQIEEIDRRGQDRLGELKVASERVEGLVRIQEASERDFGSFTSHFTDGFSIDPLIDWFMHGRGSWSDVVGEMNRFHVQRPLFSPLSGSMLGDILSELAGSFSVPPDHLSNEDRWAEPEEMYWTVHGENEVVTRRVTRRGPRRSVRS